MAYPIISFIIWYDMGCGYAVAPTGDAAHLVPYPYSCVDHAPVVVDVIRLIPFTRDGSFPACRNLVVWELPRIEVEADGVQRRRGRGVKMVVVRAARQDGVRTRRCLVVGVVAVGRCGEEA